jgi:DNA (cytosine-5)-methyltransferase 1
VLLEPEGVRRDSPTREEEGSRVARCLAASAGDGGAEGSRDELIAKPLLSHAGRQDEESETFIPSGSPTLQRSAGHHGHSSPRGDGSTPLVAGFNTNASSGDTTGYAPGLSVPVRANDPPGVVIPFNAAQVTHPENRNRCEPGEPAHTLASSGVPESIAEVSGAWARRLTPRECERLQGFPDDWTAVPGASNNARYKALGNAVAVPVVAWIAGRLAGASL